MDYVYVIAAKASKGGFKSPCKVGVTSNLKSRLSSIQNGCPFNIDLYCKIAMPSRSAAEEFERAFHKINEGKCIRGEWYRIQPLKAAHLLQLCFVSGAVAQGLDADEATEAMEVAFSRGWEESEVEALS